MKITQLLKTWLTANAGVAEDADDAEFRRSAAEALTKDAGTDGSLEHEEFVKLTADEQAPAAGALGVKMDQVIEGLAGLATAMTPAGIAERASAAAEATVVAPEPQSVSALSKTIAELGGTDVSVDPAASVRVKGAEEGYSSTKGAMHYPALTNKNRPHPFAGQPVSESERSIDTASDRDKAVAGVWAKFAIQTSLKNSKALAWASMNEHDKGLLMYALHSEKWGGVVNPSHDMNDTEVNNRKLTPAEQKAVIDDATSGGLEAAPIVFDDQIIQQPLLHGELFPKVNVVNLARGRRVEGVSVGKVTGSWGGIDDTSITLFTTTSYVSAFDTTVFRWQGAIQIGLDFLSDTPIDFGGIVTAQYGERLLEDLDDVIADGDGTTQPEGVIQKSGVSSVAFGSTTATVGGYEQLLFGVAKAEKNGQQANRMTFCSNETSYRRARAIPVGASDERRVFGMTHEDYSLLGHPYAINETLGNTEAFFAVMSRYRMYRRLGLVIKASTEGDTLMRGNLMLLTAMARYGGQLERGAAAAISTTLEA